MLFTFSNSYANLASIEGRVIDGQSKETLPGALVTIPDLKISVVTDASGQFKFNNIPEKGRFLVEVRYIGYSTLIQTIDFSLKVNLEFALFPSVIEAKRWSLPEQLSVPTTGKTAQQYLRLLRIN